MPGKFTTYLLKLTVILLLISVGARAQYPLFKNIGRNDGLNVSRINTIICDKNGTIWLATEKGAVTFNGKKFSAAAIPFELKDTEVIKIIEDHSGRLFFCTASGKIYFRKEGKFSLFETGEEIRNRISNKILSRLITDKLNNAWISTVVNGGLIQLNEKQKVNYHYQNQETEFSYYIREIENEGYIWGSSGREILNNKLRVIFGSRHFDITLSAVDAGYTKSLFLKLLNQTFLFAKTHEIIHFSENAVISRAFVEKSIECIYEDSEGKIWVGLYGGGVVCYPAGNFSSGSQISYLGEKTISGICEDNSGNIWFSSQEDGLFVLSPGAFISYTPPKIFSSGNLKSKKGKIPPVLKTVSSEDKIDFPKVNELPVVKVDSIIPDTVPPAVFISSVKIFNRDTALHSFYELEHDQNFLKINFAGFSAEKSSQLQFRYRLEGADEDWTYTNNMQAQYNSLPSGDYIFRVSAMNNRGTWSESPAEINFTIHPAVWETWWFRSSAGGFISASMLILFLFRDRQIKRRERERGQIGKKINELELQALRAQMNPHFIFNTLSSIQHFITENDSDSAIKYLSKFAKLMRRIMENSAKQVIPVRDEVKALELYLELEQIRCAGKFEYSVVVDKSIDADFDVIPSMLIQPYAENSIWHGLMPLEKKGRLDISIKIENGILICKIEDNGIGRKRSAERKKSGHKSMGMSITKERLEILNSVKENNMSVRVSDPEDDKGNSTGTIVEIFVPVQNL